jgi:hypothetical protein
MSHQKPLQIGVAVLGALFVTSPGWANTIVIGTWEDSTDGWIDWGAGQTPINPMPGGKFGYSDFGVTHGSSSLQLTQSGWNQSLAIKLQDNGLTNAFFATTQFAIDVTVPPIAPGGWMEIFEFAVNTAGYGWNPQPPVPHHQFGENPEQQTFTMVWDYSHLLDGDPANGEIPRDAGWIEFIFATNNDGAHTTFYFDNARLIGSLLPGDANLDSAVNIADLGILAANWQQPANWLGGDFNADGIVNIADLGILAANWQATAQNGATTMDLAEALAMFDVFDGAVVPEPAGVSLLALAGAVLLRRRK